MAIYNYGTLSLSAELTKEAVAAIKKMISEDKYLEDKGFDNLVGGETEIEIDDVREDEYEGLLQEFLDCLDEYGIAANGTLKYYGNYEGKIYVKDNKANSVDIENTGLEEATDEELLDILKERGYKTELLSTASQDAYLEAAKNQSLMGEVTTSAGILRAYRNPDPDQPGICVVLQPTGYEEEIDTAFVSVYENTEYQTGDKERPEDVVIMSYGDATSEDYTVKEIIRREDVIAGLGTGGKA